MKYIYFEDVIDNFKNETVNQKINSLVKKHKEIIIKGLSSKERYVIYRNVYLPLKFEKIVENENENEKNNKNENENENEEIREVSIKIFNGNIKEKETNEETNEKTNEETKNELNKEMNELSNDNDYVLSETDTKSGATEENEENEESEEESEENYSEEYITESNESYLTNIENGIEKIEVMLADNIRKTNEINKNVNKVKNRINLLFMMNIMFYGIFYYLDPVRYIEYRMCINV